MRYPYRTYRPGNIPKLYAVRLENRTKIQHSAKMQPFNITDTSNLTTGNKDIGDSYEKAGCRTYKACIRR